MEAQKCIIRKFLTHFLYAVTKYLYIILAIICILFEGCMHKQLCFINSFSLWLMPMSFLLSPFKPLSPLSN